MTENRISEGGISRYLRKEVTGPALTTLGLGLGNASDMGGDTPARFLIAAGLATMVYEGGSRVLRHRASRKGSASRYGDQPHSASADNAEKPTSKPKSKRPTDEKTAQPHDTGKGNDDFFSGPITDSHPKPKMQENDPPEPPSPETGSEDNSSQLPHEDDPFTSAFDEAPHPKTQPEDDQTDGAFTKDNPSQTEGKENASEDPLTETLFDQGGKDITSDPKTQFLADVTESVRVGVIRGFRDVDQRPKGIARIQNDEDQVLARFVALIESAKREDGKISCNELAKATKLDEDKVTALANFFSRSDPKYFKDKFALDFDQEEKTI